MRCWRCFDDSQQPQYKTTNTISKQEQQMHSANQSVSRSDSQPIS